MKAKTIKIVYLSHFKRKSSSINQKQQAKMNKVENKASSTHTTDEFEMSEHSYTGFPQTALLYQQSRAESHTGFPQTVLLYGQS